jgi:hypothetical protein
MKALFPLLALSSMAILSLAGCSSQPDRTGRSTQGFYSPSFDTLWERGGIELKESGFPPDWEASNRETRTIVSRYDTTLQPFTGKGTREQATLIFHPIEGKENTWSVEANVLREQNMNGKEPGNIRKADWKNPVRVPEAEANLVHRIETFFIGYELSPQFRNRYGMTPGRSAIPGYVNPESPEEKAKKENKDK